jgi:hypothetical protein
LALKNKAHYQDTNPTFDETQRALRSMEVVLRLAITA